MLPGVRFLFAAILISTSLLVFALGAAALLRATHDQFVSNPSWRSGPQEQVFARAEPPRPVLAALRVEPLATNAEPSLRDQVPTVAMPAEDVTPDQILARVSEPATAEPVIAAAPAEAVTSDAAKPDPVTSDTTRLETAKSEATKREATKPEMIGPEPAASALARPEAPPSPPMPPETASVAGAPNAQAADRSPSEPGRTSPVATASFPAIESLRPQVPATTLSEADLALARVAALNDISAEVKDPAPKLKTDSSASQKKATKRRANRAKKRRVVRRPPPAQVQQQQQPVDPFGQPNFAAAPGIRTR